MGSVLIKGFMTVRVCSLSLILLIGCSQSNTESHYLNPQNTECEAAQIQNSYMVKWKDKRVSVFETHSQFKSVSSFIHMNASEIEYVEPNYRIRAMNIQAQHQDHESIDNWGWKDVRADYAWDRGLYGSAVTVAVVDTGVDTQHPQLKNNLAYNLIEKNGKSGIDDDGNGYIDDILGWDFISDTPDIDDREGHGTLVSGIILAEHTTSSVKGVAPKALLLPVDFMDAYGGSTSSAIHAVNYAIERGASIVNMSWDTAYCSRTLSDAFKEWEKLNVLFVVAAGNSGRNIEFKNEFPASFKLKNQINVGAYGTSHSIAKFSNFGLPVDIYAPGVGILSILPIFKGYSDVADGTSMATPFITGEAALLLGYAPHLSALEVKKIILESVAYDSPAPIEKRMRIDYALQALGLL